MAHNLERLFLVAEAGFGITFTDQVETFWHPYKSRDETSGQASPDDFAYEDIV